jgi:hypothetical protein
MKSARAAAEPTISPKSDPRDSPSPYGALTFISWSHDWNNQFYGTDRKIVQAAELMKEAGIYWARADFLWSDLEPQEGRFDFTHQDKVINMVIQHGLKFLGTLNYNPLWRSHPWNTAPDVASYVRYVRAVVRHYKDRVKYWEVWNEPDHPTYWAPQDDMAAYSLLLKEVYIAIKTEDPTAVVLTGGLVDSSNLRKIYSRVGANAFDVVNLHPFVNPLAPNALDRLAQMHGQAMEAMKAFNDTEKPIWFTEIGCPGSELSAGGWWLGGVPTEIQQAEWLKNVYTNALKWKGVEKIFWAFLRDTDKHFKNDVDSFGLLRLDFSPKPAYHAFKKLTSAADD